MKALPLLRASLVILGLAAGPALAAAAAQASPPVPVTAAAPAPGVTAPSPATVAPAGDPDDRGAASTTPDTDDEAVTAPVGAAVAFTGGFSVLFREGLEAVLVLAAAFAVLHAARARRALTGGALAALAATALTWLVAERLLDIAPASRELISALTSLAAVLLLLPMSFWLSRQAKGRNAGWRARLETAAERGLPALFGLAFASTYREGFETVLFYQALLRAGENGREVWLGVAAAAGGLAVVAWAIIRLGARLPARRIFPILVGVTGVFAVVLTGNAAHGFQEAGWLPETPLPALQAWLAPGVSSLTGLHATAQTLVAQLALAVVLLLATRQPSPRRG